MNLKNHGRVIGVNYLNNTLKFSYKGSSGKSEDWFLLEESASPVWVIVLHGHGSVGDQLFSRRDLVDGWLPVLRKNKLGIISPNLDGNAWMGPSALDCLHKIIAYVKKIYPVKKFILLGGSMGGTGALIYAANHPEDISGVCALCPASDIARYWRFAEHNRKNSEVIAEIADAIRTSYGGTPQEKSAIYDKHSAQKNAARLMMPVYLSHGAQDALIPVAESRELASAFGVMKKEQFFYKESDKGSHDTPLSDAPDGINWVLSRI